MKLIDKNELAKIAAEYVKGDQIAGYQLARIYENLGREDEAKTIFYKLEKNGSMLAAYRLAKYYYVGLKPTDVKVEIGIALLEKASKQGHLWSRQQIVRHKMIDANFFQRIGLSFQLVSVAIAAVTISMRDSADPRIEK